MGRTLDTARLRIGAGEGDGVKFSSGCDMSTGEANTFEDRDDGVDVTISDDGDMDLRGENVESKEVRIRPLRLGDVPLTLFSSSISLGWL